MELNEKIRDIQDRLKAPKNQYNSYGDYYYRSCEDILEGIKPLLHEHGLLQYIKDDIVQVGDRVYVKATVTVTDGENSLVSHAFAREAEHRKGMDESQITGASSSYARKYALNGMWLIDDVKDGDTDEHAKQQGKKKDDEKEWINEGTKEWKRAEQVMVSREMKPHELRDYYKVSNANMEYFESIYEKQQLPNV